METNQKAQLHEEIVLIEALHGLLYGAVRFTPVTPISCGAKIHHCRLEFHDPSLDQLLLTAEPSDRTVYHAMPMSFDAHILHLVATRVKRIPPFV